MPVTSHRPGTRNEPSLTVTLPPGQRRLDRFPRFGTHLGQPAPAIPSDPDITIDGDAKQLTLHVEDAELDKRGVQVIQMNPAMATKVRKAFIDSIWKLGADCCKDEAANLRATAIKAGLTQ